MSEPPALKPNSIEVLEKRYLIKDEDGAVIESPDRMFRRVAGNVAAVNERYGDRPVNEDEEAFYRAMRWLEFLPNSPTLMNAGTSIQQLSACFVIPVEDSIEGIYDAVKYAAIIHQTGGGSGMSFSRLRPEGDVVRSTGGIASGPVSFMKVFDAATEAIKQGGRRRGANMGVLRVDHPDVERFISAKEDLTSLTNFNISVAVTDDFMRKAAAGEDFDLVNPRTGQVVRTVPASRILEKMAANAWKTGDPGIIFMDTVNRHNPTPGLGPMEATNPCGEVPLLPFEACNLGSINLDRMVTAGGKDIDWDKLGRTVELGVRFLDNVIDANRFPLPQTAEIVRGNRKIGLGVMGFADLLVRLRIPYGSAGSLELVDRLMAFIRQRAETTSREIAEVRGSFPNIGQSVIEGPRRNATVLSIAPTGTISMIAGCSSGIEPFYAISYAKHVLGGAKLEEVNELFAEEARRRGFFTLGLLTELSGRISIQDMESIPPDMRELFVTAHDIPAERQIDIQAAFQRYVDNAVSKTINLPPEASWRDVLHDFVYAHRQGCKGLTVYREGSKPGQVLTTITDLSACPTCGRLLRAEEGAMQCETCG